MALYITLITINQIDFYIFFAFSVNIINMVTILFWLGPLALVA